MGKEVVALSLEDQGLAEGCGVISPIEPQTEIPAVPAPDVLTLGKLIEQYQTDPVSGWHNLRFATRRNQETVLRRWAAQYGDRTIASLRRRDLDEMYKHWSAAGAKVSMGHSFMAQIRTVCGYGVDMLEDPDCTRLSMVLSRRKYPMGQPRKSFMTAEQCAAVCEMARNYGYNSIALAQALQFELILRQGDVIGSWVPLSEPGESDVIYHEEKWLHGLRWEEIDGDLILRHVTSKKGKEIELDLKLAPLVMREIQMLPAFMKQSRGPVVISEHNCMPWQAVTFRQKWRMLATAAGVPQDVFNMDSRAGGITEATEAGIDLEHIRHAATHSDISMTQRYARNARAKVATVQRGRLAHRQAQGGGR